MDKGRIIVITGDEPNGLGLTERGISLAHKIEKLRASGVEVIEVKSPEDLKNLGIENPNPVMDIFEFHAPPKLPEMVSLSDYNFFTDSRKSKHQKREYRKSATPIKRKR